MPCIYNTNTSENFIHNALIIPMINMTNKKHTCLFKTSKEKQL